MCSLDVLREIFHDLLISILSHSIRAKNSLFIIFLSFVVNLLALYAIKDKEIRITN
jgi:hypothetical protein